MCEHQHQDEDVATKAPSIPNRDEQNWMPDGAAKRHANAPGRQQQSTNRIIWRHRRGMN